MIAERRSREDPRHHDHITHIQRKTSEKKDYPTDTSTYKNCTCFVRCSKTKKRRALPAHHIQHEVVLPQSTHQARKVLHDALLSPRKHEVKNLIFPATLTSLWTCPSCDDRLNAIRSNNPLKGHLAKGKPRHPKPAPEFGQQCPPSKGSSVWKLARRCARCHPRPVMTISGSRNRYAEWRVFATSRMRRFTWDRTPCSQSCPAVCADAGARGTEDADVSARQYCDEIRALCVFCPCMHRCG